MKKTQPWHHTPAGAVVGWLGSIQLAVPVLLLVAAGLGVGTFLESTRGVQVAREYVYGSWWFAAVLVLVCVSLVFAVVTRYPWKRRHAGFIIVHAALVTLIGAGFWSMRSRVEGRLALDENTMSDVIETDAEQVEVMAHEAGQFVSLADAPAPRESASLTLAGVRVQVLERWQNSRDEETIADDSPEPLRAVEIAPVPGPQTAWVGQEDRAGPAPVLMGLRVLVLPEGASWQPPRAPESSPGDFVFVVGTDRYPLVEAGREVFPGWTVTDVKRFARAIVSGDGVSEGPASAPPNSAVQVRITDGRGTVEQHTAFENFPAMVMGKPLEGRGNSAARLVPGSAQGEPETLVIFGTVAATKVGYVAIDGTSTVIEPQMSYPMHLALGTRDVTIHRQLARAHQTTRTTMAPPAKDNRPALLVRVGDDTTLQTIPYKQMASITMPDGSARFLHFGPRRVRLPFTVRLADFRKTDYPGTDMAMAYESDVGVRLADGSETSFRIFMNHPYVHGPWKVYQSGFVGDTVSIFSVMHDPGLPLTYAACTLLCVGVVITFYSRSLSWGHPGIAPGGAPPEKTHGPPPDPAARVPRPVLEPVGRVPA